MITRWLKEQNPIGILLITIICSISWVLSPETMQAVSAQNRMPLFDLLLLATGNQPVWNTCLCALLTLANALLIYHLVSKNELLPRRSFLAPVVYLILFSSFDGLKVLYPALPAQSFLLIGMIRLASSYRQDEALGSFYDAGLFFGLAYLFYFPAALLFPLIWVALIVVRPFVWREWFTGIFGWLSPLLLCVTWYFWRDQTQELIYDKLLYPTEDFVLDLSAWSPNQRMIALVWLVFFIFSLLFLFFRGWSVNTILSKNFVVLWLWWTGLSALIVFIAPTLSLPDLSIFLVPLVVFASNYLSLARWSLLTDFWILSLAFSGWII